MSAPTDEGDVKPAEPDVNVQSDESGRRLKEIYTYECDWDAYALAWSNRPDQLFRLAVGSYMEEYTNVVDVVQLVEAESGLDLEKRATFAHPYPPTKLLWSPASDGPDLLATTGDYLRLWEVTPNTTAGELPSKVDLKAFLNTNKKTDFCAPLTSFDWNKDDARMLATASIDTTISVWDIEAQTATTHLIAHDKEVFDIAFARGLDVLATVGGDGSVRVFDLRVLGHSNILLEGQAPLLRVGWNMVDPNYIACFAADSKTFVVIDVRSPTSPLTPKASHTAAINAIAWPPHSACHLCSAAEDAQALIWDLSQLPSATEVEPILAYQAEGPVNCLHWSAQHPDWMAIGFGKKLQTLRV